ncbi:hypothetical protein Rs2_03679 [Raphanus sativus]|uniref:Leucine-rich repeat extensin-like protein 5 isoform X2 n=1 Tax=Raphanus sativus TaxID=3726 RepID=A0A6J0M874_RAPSA|nr:leucine-rich repeat extensin-like protein 5 isoform X2 [Raphanus sativus]KAJ4909058.1 hypothetical protein Rs2_03679 [Raphanus sativus]
MESNRALITIFILLCLFLSASFFTHSADARKLVGLERDSKKRPKKLTIKALKHTSVLEKMMTQLNLAQPLDCSTTSSNTQPNSVSATLSLSPYVPLAPLSVPDNAPPFCVNPPNIPLNLPPFSSYPELSPPPGPIIVPNPPESSSNPNSNPNPPDSTSNPNSIPNPPETSSSNPNPPESSSNPNPPESSSNPSPPVTVPNPPDISSPNPSETVPSPSVPGYSPGPSGPISGPPYSEPGPSTSTNTPTPSGNIPTPSSEFLPPIVYPPPMVPPPPSVSPASGYWCVAKPSVPDPIIQEAMNFACGSGADCHSIQPNGSCFKPNTLWAHASYAFNSYWQRTKGSGGSCSFGGTGMLVTVDPSFNGCHFDFF